jgi:hypothetical protein
LDLAREKGNHPVYNSQLQTDKSQLPVRGKEGGGQVIRQMAIVGASMFAQFAQQLPQLETGKNRGLRRLRIACFVHSWVPTRQRGAPVLVQNAGPYLQ